MLRLHFLVTLILCALLATQGLVQADHELQGDIPEPGQTDFTEESAAAAAEGPPEPGSTILRSANETKQGPPEPSTRPHFTGSSSTSSSQGPLEPSVRSTTTLNQGPPEPSTRPHFSNATGTQQGPPEPSTRPHYSEGSTSGNQGPPEPSTRPHYSGSSSTSSIQGPPEPSTRPHYVQQQAPSNRPTVVVTQSSSRAEVSRAPAPYYPYVQPRLPYQAEPEPDPSFYHLHDHPSIVNRRLDRPFSQQVWKCDLRVNGCFLRSKVNFVPFVTQYNFEGTLNSLVLDVSRAALKRHQLTRRPNPVYSYNAARLESTSYFEAKYADACVAFSYFWNGVGKKSVHVLQRSNEDVCIYSAVHDPTDPNSRATGGMWQDLQLQVDLRHGPAKFWIEYQFDIGEKRAYPYNYQDLGYIAIRNFSIGYGSCTAHSASWECDVPVSR